MSATLETIRAELERIGREVAAEEWRKRGAHGVLPIRLEDLERLCTEAAERGAAAEAGGYRRSA